MPPQRCLLNILPGFEAYQRYRWVSEAVLLPPEELHYELLFTNSSSLRAERSPCRYTATAKIGTSCYAHKRAKYWNKAAASENPAGTP